MEKLNSDELPPSGHYYSIDYKLTKIYFVAFVFFLCVVLVHITFRPADSIEGRLFRTESAESGDTFKQLTYFIIFILCLFSWISRYGFSLPRCASIPQILLVVWIVLSASWALEPYTSFRRGVLLVFVFFTMASCIDALGPQKSIQALYYALAGIMVASVVSVFVFPSFAVHPGNEADVKLIGAWRGVMIHKNTAAGVCAMAALVFFHHAIARSRWYDWFFLGVCVIFLVGSKGKTASGLLLVVAPLSLIYLWGWGGGLGRAAIVIYLFLFSLMAIVFGVAYWTDIVAVFADPQSFTGRVAIWDAAFGFWKDHPILGAGYSSLWSTSLEPSPILKYSSNPAVVFMAHSHSGYLEILATTGIPGFILAIISAVIIPAKQFFGRVNPKNMRAYSMLFSLWLFGILENFMETQLFTRDREIWSVLFVAILVLHLINANEARTRFQNRL